MTKKDWYNTQIGFRVQTKSFEIVKNDDKIVSVDKILTGTIIRINSNRSQVLVKWDDSDLKIWYGRLGLEMLRSVSA